MNLMQLILKDNEQIDKLLLYIGNGFPENRGKDTYVLIISGFNAETSKRVYGLKYIILKHIFKGLPDIYAENITPIEYSSICQFENIRKIYICPFTYYPIKFVRNDGYEEIKLLHENDCNFTVIEAVTKDQKFKSIKNLGYPGFFFFGITDDNKFSLFFISITVDKNNTISSEIKYIAKDCINFGYVNGSDDWLLFKENDDSIEIFSYIDGIESKKYKGKIVSRNLDYIILKRDNEYLFFSNFDSEPIAIYSNDNIINMQFCSIDEDDRLDNHFDVLILTTKDNKQKLLPIIVNSDGLSFIETEKEFDSLDFAACFITRYQDEITNGYTFYGYIGDKTYEIGVTPNGNIEILGTSTQESRKRKFENLE